MSAVMLLQLVHCYVPIVLWHGMSDTCCNADSMGNITAEIDKVLPGVFIHSIRIGNSETEDRSNGFFGSINEQVRCSNQVDQVCGELKQINELKHGFNGLGFSQGGLFLRAYVQRCDGPPIHTLMTFGSPHAGISSIPDCTGALCESMKRIVKLGVYWKWVQHKVIQAQYYKDYKMLAMYLAGNIFLPELNQELGVNAEHVRRMASLKKLVLVKFSDDEMIIPAESAWFSFYDSTGTIIPAEKQPLYALLAFLDFSGKIVKTVMEGAHMNIGRAEFQRLVVAYFSDTAEILGVQRI